MISLWLALASFVDTPAPRQPLQQRRDARSGLLLVRLPAGDYPDLPQLDSTPEPAGTSALPPELRHLPGFWIGQTHVTVSAYVKCVQAGACAAAVQHRDEPVPRCSWKNQLEDHPVNCITWTEAADYCQWIGARLPTATEWEYAAASGERTRSYPWGEAPVDAQHANYCDQNCVRALGTMPNDGKNLAQWEQKGMIDHAQDDGWAATSPASAFPRGATPWGLLDMAGNVWQWTATAAGEGAREVRGGSWDNAPKSLRIDRRLAWPARAADAGMGFRCVKDLPAQLE